MISRISPAATPLFLTVILLVAASPATAGNPEPIGSGTRITPAKVLAAAKLIREGKVYSLGRDYEAGMPLFPGRVFSLTIPGNPTSGPFGENSLVGNDEMVTAQIGQVGTQLDGLGHIGKRNEKGEDVYYGGHKGADVITATGIKEIGIERAGAFFTRGVLVDVAGAKGVERLEGGYEITLDDVKTALAKQKTEVGEGDVVLFRTGHAKLWNVDNEAYNKSCPGIGVEVAKWLVERKIALVGADTWPTEVIPHADPKSAYPVHQILIAENGIYNLENLDLDELAAAGVHEFAFVLAPLRLKGGTGSPGNPIAVR